MFIAPEFRLELHLDTDEANAAGVSTGDLAELLLPVAGNTSPQRMRNTPD